MNVAVVGATGLVGQKILEILTERQFQIDKLIPVASQKSVGKTVRFKDADIEIISAEDAVSEKPQIAIFSAGSDVSLEWAPKFAEQGTFVIDNSSAWRTDKHKKLIIPEINANILTKDDRIIANPNCSTIQMLMAVAPLHRHYKIKRLVISTYQSITGTGVKAVQQLENERQNIKGDMAYPHPIDKNCLPHCDVFLENDYTKEEMKLVNETHKILDADIKITATAVRVPVAGGHSESVNVEFESDFNIADIRQILEQSKGVQVIDNVRDNAYPMPINAQGKDDVFVGRIRRDYSCNNALNLWIVADNLRKGAATNAVQIAEYIRDNNFIKQ